MKRQLENQKAQKGPLLASSSEGQWLYKGNLWRQKLLICKMICNSAMQRGGVALKMQAT